MLKAIKVRIYPTDEQQSHLAQAFGCVRWVWNQSLSTMSETYKETGKGISAFDIKKQIPFWKAEHDWLKTCYSQCLQQSVLNLSQALDLLHKSLINTETADKKQINTDKRR